MIANQDTIAMYLHLASTPSASERGQRLTAAARDGTHASMPTARCSRLRTCLGLPLALAGLLACSERPSGPAAKQDSTATKAKAAEAADPSTKPIDPPTEAIQATKGDFKWIADRFADVQVLRYQVPGFEALSLQQKQLLYYLSQAALSGRDITYDQKFAGNLAIRRTFEAILRHPGAVEDESLAAMRTYAKRVWFSNGIHHHYSGKKFEPGFPQADFEAAVRAVDASKLPLEGEETVDQLLARIVPMIFDPKVAAKRTNRDDGADPVADSANNFYGPGVTAKMVEDFYKAKIDPKDPTPISWGLNSRLVLEDGELREQVWSAEGMYGPAIREIVKWLEKAISVAENEAQRKTLSALVAYYQSGDLAKFDAYNIAWVADTDSLIDTINGFIEVYDDALGYRGSWESVVWFQDPEASKRIETISKQAQYFEDSSPILAAHKKPDVVGISAEVITVVTESGDAAPSTPIGINLPNANWIRMEHGSKSVNLGNIVAAYDEAKAGNGLLEEFCFDDGQIARAKQHGVLGHKLLVDMHEVIGHASGRLEDGVGTPKETLKSYASALEEARADLVALYYILDPKLVELGLMPSLEVGHAEYESYVRNGLLVQLARLELGEQIEESHMRNRQMVAAWAHEKGKADKVIERKERDGKVFFVINDYAALRGLFGELLKEVQRIKSQGDYEAGKALIEGYGVKVDAELHAQVKARYDALGIAPYSGFIQPKLVPVMEGETITDVRIEYPDDFEAQMLEFADAYSFL